MRYLLIIAGLSGLSVASAAEAPVLTVPQVIERHEALDGKVVRVSGWLHSRCYRFGCSITNTRDGKGAYLSLGGSGSFDLAVQKAGAQGRKILVEGRVNHTCFDHSKDPGNDPRELTICTDRADELADPRLISVYSSSSRKK
jgi:hypothetical protein